MAQGIQLLAFKNGSTEAKDITQLVDTIKWTGRRGSPSRSLTASLLDDEGFAHERSGINVLDGWQCLFNYDGEELFRGIFMSQGDNRKKALELKAYDNGIYLSNNDDTFVYEAKTADAIFRDVCTRFGIPVGTVASCGYTIPDLVKKKTSGWDAIEDALSLEYKNTGTRYYVLSKKGAVSLLKRQENILQWVLEIGANISDYKRTISIEDLKTRIKLLSKEGTVLAEASDPALEKKYGIMQGVETPDETLNSAQLTAMANTLLGEKKKPKQSLTMNNILGIPDVVSGVGVFVIIPRIGVKRTLYVESDTHTFKDKLHTMTLQLSYTSDF